MSNFEDNAIKLVNDVPATGTPHSWASTTNAAAARPLRGGLRAASDRPHRGLAEKSEDNLTSPTQLTTEGDLRSGESLFRAGGCEEWGSALHRAGPEDARWEGRCSSPGEMTMTAQGDVQYMGMYMLLLDIGCLITVIISCCNTVP